MRSNDGATTSKLLEGNTTPGYCDGTHDASERLSDPYDKEDDEDVVDDKVHDTVGVVVLDWSGLVASTVSSGDIALKQPGRVRGRYRPRKNTCEASFE